MPDASLILSPLDGAAPLEILQRSSNIYLALEGSEDLLALIPEEEVEYSNTPGGVGAFPLVTTVPNIVRPGRVFIKGADEEALEANVLLWQQTLADAARYGAELIYTSRTGATATIEVVKAQAQRVGQDSVFRRDGHAESSFTLTCLPYALLETVTGTLIDRDPFNRDTISEGRWRFDAGSGTLGVVGGQLVPSSTAEKRLYRPIKVEDATITLKLRTGASAGVWRLRLKRLDDSNYLMARWDGVTWSIRKVDGGATTTLATDSFASSATTDFWLRFQQAGNVLTARIYTADPEGGASPAITVTHTLTGADATKFGTGIWGNPGIGMVPNNTNERYDDWKLTTTAIQSSEPFQDIEIEDPGGSVDARTVFTLTDITGQDRSHVEGGVDRHYDPDNPTPLFLDAGPSVTLLTSAAADDIFDATAHGFVTGNRVRFMSLTGGAGLTVGKVYYVIAANLAANTFQVSETEGGSAVNFTSDITAGTVVNAAHLGPLAGATNTSLTGEYGGSTLRATLTTTPVAICDSGPQEHLGLIRHKPRLYGDGTGPIWVRLAYKVGSSPRFKQGEWVQLPAVGAWYELDLGLMHIREPVQGTQSCEWRIEAYSETAGDTLDVDYDQLIPAPGWKVRTPLEIGTPEQVSAWSDFTTESGAITGDSLRVGGTWTGAGDADDFSVAGGVATRTALSDSSSTYPEANGRLIVASTPTLGATAVQVDFKRSSAVELTQGVLLRYVDSSNYAAAIVLGEADPELWLIRRVAGTTTAIDSKHDFPPIGVDAWHTIEAFADGDRVGARLDGGTFLVGSNSALASGGALDDGKVGIVDHCVEAIACTRTYDNFFASPPTFDRAIYSGKSLEVHSDQIIREHPSGEWGRIDSTGGYPTLPPGRPSRIVVKARRNDTDELPDDVIDDAISVQAEITPRVSLL